MDTRDVLLVVAILVAGPWGIVLLALLARGYDLTVTFTRRPRQRGSSDE